MVIDDDKNLTSLSFIKRHYDKLYFVIHTVTTAHILKQFFFGSKHQKCHKNLTECVIFYMYGYLYYEQYF